MKKLMLTLVVVGRFGLAGCAATGANYAPIADGPVSITYAADLETCQQLATKRGYMNDDTKTNAMIGAGLGALAGLADDGGGALAGAVVGALAGGGAGMVETREQRRQIVIECMKGRGHRVVG